MAVTRFPKPTTHKAVQCFLGLTRYFRKFILQFTLIAQSLSQLLKKKREKFVFATEQERAFEQLKTVLASELVLKLYKVGAETKLHTSRCDLRVVLLQRNTEDNQSNFIQSIMLVGKPSETAEERYSSYELEVLAVIKALQISCVLAKYSFPHRYGLPSVVQTMSKKEVSKSLNGHFNLKNSFMK